MELKKYLAIRANEVNKALKRYMPPGGSLTEQAMRYALLAGGKRLRPVLALEAAKICGGNPARIMPAACALEFIHTYSLVHDDLPAMDDDDLRRGKPTTHRKFGEAAGILAGDALLTDAFRLMAACAPAIPAARVVKAVELVSSAAGFNGMVGGQMKDTVETDKWQKKGRKTLLKTIEYIHLNKTAALIQASLLAGATLSGAGKKQMKALNAYGRHIGLAFQIADDILDITADKKLLGKRGSDRDNNKLTYPALFGLDGSRALAAGHVSKAKKALSIFGTKAEILRKLADYIIERQY
jgi:geranylgeranyl diphosphate synthase, type II